MTRRTGRAGAQKTQAKYDAAGNGRRIRSWSPPSSGPNRAIEGLQKIRDRARDSSRNDWAGASAVQKWTTNLVGVGITPRWTNSALNDLWGKFVPTADADGVLDLYGMQALGVRSWLDGGEVFLRRRPRDFTLGLPAPVQFQLIEADFVPLFDADTWPGLPVGNTIRQGIERNKYGRRTAYWMFKEHPGDRPLRPTPNDLIRIAASDVRHVFEPKRPGQLRGVSELAPVLVRIRASMDFEDAVLDRQKLANLFVGFIMRELPEAADIEFDPLTGLPKFYNAEGTPMAGLEPGMMQELQPGEDVKFANPPEAGTTYSDYLRSTHVGTAAGAGLPYEVMSGDIKDVSDRTLRIVINEFRRFARQRQWHVVIPMLCQPMVDWWADALALSGAIVLSALDAAKKPKWSPEGWEYIHPVQDAEGKIALINAGIVSRASVISDRGDDPAAVDAERAEDKKRADRMGLAPPEPKPAHVAKPTPKALEIEDLQLRRVRAEIVALEREPAPVLPPPVADNSAMNATVAGLTTMNATVANLAGAVAAIASRPAAEIHVEPTPLAVTVEAPHVTNQVNPTPVTVAVDVAAPTVSVAAPSVQITNDVQPAAVEVSVSLPDRKTTSDIDRDRDGNITKVTQIEKTLQ